jgi:hypothetical protein
MGRKRGTGMARNVAPTQRDILPDVMLAAGKYGAWMTLRELARLTRYGEASISAQPRHLRRLRIGKARSRGGDRRQRGTFCGVGVPADVAALEATTHLRR